MMNFYYHPLLGLQYNYLENLFLIDLRCFPQDIKFDKEQWMKYIRETGIAIVQPNTNPPIEIFEQIINYKL